MNIRLDSLITSVFVLVACWGLHQRVAAEKQVDKPNIIIFYADDMGLGDIRAYDPESTIPTPNMDRLAAEGIRFSDAHSASAVCSPSRYSILTGRHEFRSQLNDLVWRSPYAPPLLDSDHETLPELLRRGGYNTAAFGKWHIGMSWPSKTGDGPAREGVNTSRFTTTEVDFTKPIMDGPLNHGFNYFFGIGSTINQGPYTFIENDRVTVIPKGIRAEVKIGGGFFREGWIAERWDAEQINGTVAKKATDFIGNHQRISLRNLSLYTTPLHQTMFPTSHRRVCLIRQ